MTPYLHKVQYYETDKMQITHHSNYIRFMEEARIDFFEKLGFPYDQFESNGVLSPVVSISCEYKQTTTYPDILSIKVAVSECKKFKFTLSYTISKGENIVCTGKSTHCFLDDSGKPICFYTAFPALYEALSSMVE